ncbi:MAG: hypothetical protein WAP37_01930, partial [Solirubrobacterales bacterium]
ANANSGVNVKLDVPLADATIQNSHFKDVAITFPAGVKPNLAALGSLTECSDAELTSDSCPATSDLGSVSASIPPLPPAFTGDIYLRPAGASDLLGLAIVLRGPRGVKAKLNGAVTVDASNRLVATFAGLPQIPFTALDLTVTTQLFRQPATCGTNVTDANLTGHSGAVANRSSSYATTGC